MQLQTTRTVDPSDEEKEVDVGKEDSEGNDNAQMGQFSGEVDDVGIEADKSAAMETTVCEEEDGGDPDTGKEIWESHGSLFCLNMSVIVLNFIILLN